MYDKHMSNICQTLCKQYDCRPATNLFVAGRKKYVPPGDKYIRCQGDKYIYRLATDILSPRGATNICRGAANVCQVATNMHRAATDICRGETCVCRGARNMCRVATKLQLLNKH